MKNTKTNVWSFATAKLQAKKRSFFAIALIVMAIIPVYAQQYNPESDFQIDWDKDIKDGVVITGYIGTRREVSIPPKIQNNPVTGIKYDAFRRNKNITKVTIPNGVISIEGAFTGCTSLTSITIPNSVTEIDRSAFSGCTSLTSITIPNSVTSFGGGTFYGCTSLTSVTIPDSVTTGIGKQSFKNCTNLTSVTIGNGVTSIEEEAFSYTKLTSITIPDNVKSIGTINDRSVMGGDGAFDGCTSLKNVIIGNGVESIGDNTFSKCESLTSVSIGNSVTTIGRYAFSGCRSLTSIIIPASVTSIRKEAFMYCTSVTFQGTIIADNLGTKDNYFGIISPFSGDLRDKYLASDGGPGTYTRFAGGQTWKKQ